MPTIICDHCQYVGSGAEFNDRIGDVEEHERTCKENPDYTDEPEIVECEIRVNDSVDQFYFDGLNMCPLSQVFNCPDFIGFKFLDGTVFGLPVKYSVPGMTSHGYYASYEDLKTKQALEHHATHVLFRRKKKE